MKLPSIHKYLSYAKDTFKNYPLSMACSVLAFLFVLFLNHNFKITKTLSKDAIFCYVQTLVLGIWVFTALHILVYNYISRREQKLGLYILGFCITGLHFYYTYPQANSYSDILAIKTITIHSAFILIVPISLFFKYSQHNELFNFINKALLYILTATLFSIALFVGLGLAVWGVEKLFGFNFQSKYYFDLFFGIVFLFFVPFILYNLNPNKKEYEEAKEFPNSLRIFIQYILIPIIGVYALILIFYFGKILIKNNLPQGYVCIPILIFSILGILAIALSNRLKEKKEYFTIQFLHKYFYYFLLVFVSVYFVAIINRIKHYGYTEWRLIALLLGIWLAIVSLKFIFIKKINYNVAFGIISLFLIALNLGPLNIFELSARSQKNRLQKKINNYYLNQNDTTAQEVYDITNYLYNRNEFEKLNQIKNRDQKTYTPTNVKTEKTALNYLEFWKINTKNYNSNYNTSNQNIYFYFPNNPNTNGIIPLNGLYKNLLHVNLQNGFDEDIQNQTQISLENNTIYINKNGIIDSLNLNKLKDSLVKISTNQYLSTEYKTSFDIEQQSFEFLQLGKSYKIYPSSLTISKQDSLYFIHDISALMMY